MDRFLPFLVSGDEILVRINESGTKPLEIRRTTGIIQTIASTLHELVTTPLTELESLVQHSAVQVKPPITPDSDQGLIPH